MPEHHPRRCPPRGWQIHRELEDASWLWRQGMLAPPRDRVLPLARPGVIAAMTLLFILADLEVSGSSLCPLHHQHSWLCGLLLDYYEGVQVCITSAFTWCRLCCSRADRQSPHYLSRGAASARSRHKVKKPQKWRTLIRNAINRRPFAPPRSPCLAAATICSRRADAQS